MNTPNRDQLLQANYSIARAAELVSNAFALVPYSDEASKYYAESAMKSLARACDELGYRLVAKGCHHIDMSIQPHQTGENT